MTIKFSIKGSEIPDGTILILGVSYVGSNSGRIYTYALLKSGGLFYGTGSGKVPQAAGWGAVERWLADESRTLESVSVVTETAPVWPSPGAPEVAPIVQALRTQVDTSQAAE